MKVNKKGMAATGLLVAASMLTLAGCAGGSSAAPSDDASKGDSGALTVWVDANRSRALEDRLFGL
ncbi:hypothetical protein [Microbacterium lacticum]